MTLIQKITKWIDSMKPKSFNFELNDLYILTKYGRLTDEESVFKNIIKCINNSILFKAKSGQYSLVIDVKDDINKYKDRIIEYYSSRNLIAQLVNIQVTGKELSFILISWAK